MEPIAQNQRDEIETRFVLSADLGQSQDPTAIAVMEHTRLRRYKRAAKPWFAPVLELERSTVDVRYLTRLPLGLSYIEVVGEVGRVARAPAVDNERMPSRDR